MDTSNSKFRENIGQKFGKLSILDIDENKSQEMGSIYFKCRCDCGNELSIRANSIVHGRSSSCGCNRAIHFKRITEVYMNDEKGYGIAFVNKRNKYGTIDNNYFIAFNSEDKDIVMNSSWHINANGYVAGSSRGNYKNPKRILLHRAIVENYEGDIGDRLVDHIDHNKLDLRYDNLRSCNHSQNVANKISVNSDKNEHYKYIWYDENQKLYRVTFKNTTNGVLRKITKSTKTLEEAIKFRDKYLKENSISDFYYDNGIDNRDNLYYIGFPNEYYHPFYIVDNNSMSLPNSINVINPFVYINGNNIESIRDIEGHKAIQPFDIINPLKFNKGVK